MLWSRKGCAPLLPMLRHDCMCCMALAAAHLPSAIATARQQGHRPDVWPVNVLQQAALDVSDFADKAELPTVRFVDVEDAMNPAFERPALIVLPPQPLCRLGPPVLDESSPLPTCEPDTPEYYLDVRTSGHERITQLDWSLPHSDS